MQKLCKHKVERVITDILDPKFSTDEVLIDTNDVKDVENVVIRFKNEGSKKKYGWFYMSGKMIRRYRTQPNGRIMVYVVPLNKREEFTPIKDCNCENLEFDLFK